MAMTSEILWAPWRLAYVQGHERGAARPQPEPVDWRPGADRDCFLCRAAAAGPAAHRALGVLGTTAHSVVVTNRFPYSNGRLLVAPLDHRATSRWPLE